MAENGVCGSGRSQRSAATRAAAGNGGGEHFWPESAPGVAAAVRTSAVRARAVRTRAVRASARRDRLGQGTFDRGDRVEELCLQGGRGSDHCECVMIGFAIAGVLLDDRGDNGSLEWLVGRPEAQRSPDTCAAFRGERDHDRLLPAGEVVVVGARRHPSGLGDVIDPDVLRPAFPSEAQRGGAEGLPSGDLLALPDSSPLVRAHITSIDTKTACTHLCVHATLCKLGLALKA